MKKGILRAPIKGLTCCAQLDLEAPPSTIRIGALANSSCLTTSARAAASASAAGGGRVLGIGVLRYSAETLA